jgi:hypothetical protein
MQVYTVTFYNRFGPVRRNLRVECASDDDAIQFAATTGSDLKVELWQGDRRVWRFEPLVRWMPRSRLKWFWERQSDLAGPDLLAARRVGRAQDAPRAGDEA